MSALTSRDEVARRAPEPEVAPDLDPTFEDALEDPAGEPDDEESIPAHEPFDKRAWWRAVLLLHVGLAVVVGGYLLHRTTATDPAGDATAGPTSSTSAPVVPGASTTRDRPPAGSTTPRPKQDMPAPVVPALLRADLAHGDGWPFALGSRDTSTVSWPIAVVHDEFTHGPPEGADAVSWLERWTRSNVRLLGARVVFPLSGSGSVALTAWHTSVLDESGASTPRTGMRLVAEPGRWWLFAVEGSGADAERTTTLASGTWPATDRTARFELARSGRRAWVTAPDSQVTRVVDPRIAGLAGPWASWELREDHAGQRPAAFRQIWAG